MEVGKIDGSILDVRATIVFLTLSPPFLPWMCLVFYGSSFNHLWRFEHLHPPKGLLPSMHTIKKARFLSRSLMDIQLPSLFAHCMFISRVHILSRGKPNREIDSQRPKTRNPKKKVDPYAVCSGVSPSATTGTGRPRLGLCRTNASCRRARIKSDTARIRINQPTIIKT